MNDRFKFRVIIEKPYKTVNGNLKGQLIQYCNGFIQTKTKTYFFGNNKRISILNSQIKAINQCTGLKDKNGKLIYEGDIVQILGDEIPYVIDFEQDRAMFVIHSEIDRVCCNFDNYSGTELEVIGNIYENKSLLESEE